MTAIRYSESVAILALLVVSTAVHSSPAVGFADDVPAVRPQAVLNLSFDEATGEALDSATAGVAPDQGTLQNGVSRVKSPFWGQSGRQALALDGAARQFAQIADSPDVDRPDAVSFSLFFVNLHPSTDGAFHGLVAKRDEAKQITNYGINYVGNQDTLQVYVNDGTGYKTATYSLNSAAGSRRPVFLTAVFQAGDAPPPAAGRRRGALAQRRPDRRRARRRTQLADLRPGSPRC
jgi:hypothetical protein